MIPVLWRRKVFCCKDLGAVLIVRFGRLICDIVAGLTERIRYLTTHLATHKKDNGAKKGLSDLVSRRRTLLQYLKREDYPRYKTLRLALRLRPI
jgi:ribosomal protein S15